MNDPLGLYDGMDMTKVMYGQNAVHVGINLIVQRVDADNPEIVTGVFQSSCGSKLLYGANEPHVLILGDVVVRPRLAVASRGFRGSGLSSLATHGFTEPMTWLEGGRILVGGKELLEEARLRDGRMYGR